MKQLFSYNCKNLMKKMCCIRFLAVSHRNPTWTIFNNGNSLACLLEESRGIPASGIAAFRCSIQLIENQLLSVIQLHFLYKLKTVFNFRQKEWLSSQPAILGLCSSCWITQTESAADLVAFKYCTSWDERDIIIS